MTTGKQLELGFRTYFDSIGFIFSKGLWWAFAVPVVLNVLLFIGGYTLIGNITSGIQQRILDLVGLNGSDFFLSDVLSGFLSGVIWVLLKVLFFFLFAYWGGYITLILLSPLFAYLSEKTEEIISGKKYPFNGDQWMRDIWRGILISFRNMFIQTGWMILFFFLGFIPVIGWFGAIVLFIISAYFYGFAFIDYTSERRRMKIRDSVQFVRSNKWLAISNGAIFSLFLLLPFCGALFSGFAAIVSVVAATLAANEISPVQK
jgi:CysZ protein